MKFFIDTANRDEIREAASLGILDGVTTNPTLLAREVERTGGEPREILADICGMVEGPVSAEVVSMDPEGIVRDGLELAKIHENICIKVPMTTGGIKAVKLLREKEVITNMTLVFSANQALLAAKADSSFVSPFIGRLDDIGVVGMDLVREIVAIYDNYEIPTEVIVASIRHPLHVIDAALAGADAATIPFAVIEKMVKHPLTDIGLERFLADWDKVKKR